MRAPHPDPPARKKILKAATRLMVERGFPATSVDDVCATAQVTKGSFFHYFETKEALGAAVLDAYLDRVKGALAALTEAEPDPMARLRASLAYLCEAAENGPLRHGCILGGFAQDISSTHPKLRERCARHFEAWLDRVASDIAEAASGRAVVLDARPLAEHVLATFEGALLLAKVTREPSVVRRTLDHTRRHLEACLGEQGEAHASDSK
jgi:TetR/AcrR family transcriptional regulator, transcriptional repressor for nem operon